MAANGYPGDYEKGSVIEGLDEAAQIDGVEIFHAGTKADGARILANGGRVLNVCGIGKSVAEAQSAAYAAVDQDRLAGRLLPPRHRRARRSSAETVRVRDPCPTSPISFPDFASHWIDTSAGKMFARSGGNGPPLLLLHGYAQTNVMWHQRGARARAEHFTLVIPDLPGYGWSAAPRSGKDHAPYDKRSMAKVMIEMMEKLGTCALPSRRP